MGTDRDVSCQKFPGLQLKLSQILRMLVDEFAMENISLSLEENKILHVTVVILFF